MTSSQFSEKFNRNGVLDFVGLIAILPGLIGLALGLITLNTHDWPVSLLLCALGTGHLAASGITRWRLSGHPHYRYVQVTWAVLLGAGMASVPAVAPRLARKVRTLPPGPP